MSEQGEPTREALRQARADAEAQVSALSDDLRGVIEASRSSNADDEHDPEGATIAFERAQVDRPPRGGQAAPRRPGRRSRPARGRRLRHLRSVRPADPARATRGAPRRTTLRRLRVPALTYTKRGKSGGPLPDLPARVLAARRPASGARKAAEQPDQPRRMCEAHGMDPTRAEIAESFSRHDFARAYAHLSEDVRWEVIGDRRIEGRDDVIAACEASASYLDGVTTRFLSFRTMVGPDFVVTDSRAEYIRRRRRDLGRRVLRHLPVHRRRAVDRAHLVHRRTGRLSVRQDRAVPTGKTDRERTRAS